MELKFLQQASCNSHQYTAGAENLELDIKWPRPAIQGQTPNDYGQHTYPHILMAHSRLQTAWRPHAHRYTASCCHHESRGCKRAGRPPYNSWLFMLSPAIQHKWGCLAASTATAPHTCGQGSRHLHALAYRPNEVYVCAC
jgi:hypothetical protein